MTSLIRRLLPAGFAALVLLGAPAVGAHAEPGAVDPLGCAVTVHDPDGLLDLSQLNPVILTTAGALDADIRIRVEGTLDGGLDERIQQLREQCSGWSDGDELADDMVVVLLSPVERENSIFFGADLGPVLGRRWDAATDAMIPHLRAGDFTEAVDAALDGLRSDPLASSSTPASSSSDTSSASDDGSGAGALVFAFLLVAAVVGISLLSKQMGWSGGGGEDGDAGWSGSTRRRRSFGSFGSSFGSRSRSSSRSSRSSRGSRRAGGGTKKW